MTLDLNDRSTCECSERPATLPQDSLIRLLEGVADWVWQIDAAGRFTYSNGRVWDILGYTPAEVFGKTRFDFMDPAVAAEVREIFERIAQRAEPYTGFECRMRRKDGVEVFLECSAHPIDCQEQGPGGYIGIDRDISRAKRYEAEREELILQLGRSVTEVKTLSGMLPICANCKKIRDDQGYWQHLERYISQHSEAQFSHGLCPDCVKQLYGIAPEIA